MQVVIDVDFEKAAFGCEETITINKEKTCVSCSGTGAKNGATPATCDYCNGMGEVRRQQGFFTVATTCPKCQGTGTMIKDPCGSCSGSGVTRKKSELSVKIPAGIDDGQRLKLRGEGMLGSVEVHQEIFTLWLGLTSTTFLLAMNLTYYVLFQSVSRKRLSELH